MGKLRGWFYGERIHLDTIKRYNRHVEELVGSRPKILARRKAEGRERIRWWVGARRAQRAAEEAVGLPRLTAIDNAAMERLFAAEKEVENTPAKGMRGVLIKLREAHYQISNQHSFPAPGEVWELDVVGAVLHDFERLIGGMRP